MTHDQHGSAIPAPQPPRAHWLVNEAKHQVGNFATLLRKDAPTPLVEVPPADTLLGRYARTGTQWESWLHEYFDAYADPDAIALDVGANVGFHTGRLARDFRAVHAFEPCSDTTEYLRRNVAGYGNVTVHQCAVGAEPGTAHLVVEERNRGMSHIGEGAGEEVEVVTLDQLDFGGRVALMKVDVEGYEAAAFAGAQRLLSEDRPVIVFEDTEGDARKVLKAAGYQVTRIAIVDFIAIPR